jgi:hypothetical protein
VATNNGKTNVYYRVYGNDGEMYGQYFTIEEAELKVLKLEEEWKRENDDFENDFFYIEEAGAEYTGNN